MIDLYNPENKENTIAKLRDGATSDFWEIIQSALAEILKDIQEQIDGKEITQLTAEEYKVMMEILKGRKRDLLKLMELPNTLILDLEDPDQTQPDLRVYEDESDLDPSK